MHLDLDIHAIERERRRVAKELHDEILPTLARLVRFVQSRNGPRELVDELHNTVAAIRDLLGELHPVDLEELGLVPALNNICNRYARLTGLCVVFIERVEECPLSQTQQLCLYRAMQAALRMFSNSENDILLVSYDRFGDSNVITVRCVDKRVSSAEWLSVDKPEFHAFQSWCGVAGAQIYINVQRQDDFPCDLVIVIPDEMQLELDVVSSPGIDASVPNSSVIAEERKRISRDINKLIVPRLQKVHELADRAEDDMVRLEIAERLIMVANGMCAVISDLHLQLLNQSTLTSSITALVDRFRRNSAILTTISTDPRCDRLDIPLQAKFAIYRVTQESLNNIEKHSGATFARVSAFCTDEGLIVQIEDNGKGFNQGRSTLTRGVKNIRERATAVGAQVSWEKSSSFASGTLVTIRLGCSLSRTCGPTQSARQANPQRLKYRLAI